MGSEGQVNSDEAVRPKVIVDLDLLLDLFLVCSEPGDIFSIPYTVLNWLLQSIFIEHYLIIEA